MREQRVQDKNQKATSHEPASVGRLGPLKRRDARRVQYNVRTNARPSMVQRTNSLGGMLKIRTMNRVHAMATVFMAGPHLPRFHGANCGVTNSPAPNALLRAFR